MPARSIKNENATLERYLETLENSLRERYRDQRRRLIGYYLALRQRKHPVSFDNLVEENLDLTRESLREIERLESPWAQEKEDFYIEWFDDDAEVADCELHYLRSFFQAIYYKARADEVQDLIKNFGSSRDYFSVKQGLGEVVAKEIVVGSRKVRITNFSGDSVMADLFCNTGFLVHAVFLLVASLVCALPIAFMREKPAYFGTGMFLKDQVVDMAACFLKIFSSIIFPVGMCVSKYQTGSFNIFKGSDRRLIDSINSLCDEEESRASLAICA